MNEFIAKCRNEYGEAAFTIARVLIGLLFIQHGAQKLFGAFSENGPQELFSLMGLAGIIEFFGGLLLVLGLFTTIVASISGLLMVVAYFTTHAPRGLAPLTNGGELALLYLATFIILAFHGGGRYSIDATMIEGAAQRKKRR